LILTCNIFFVQGQVLQIGLLVLELHILLGRNVLLSLQNAILQRIVFKIKNKNKG